MSSTLGVPYTFTITNTITWHAQQTAQLEHETFALKQQATLTAEVKSVLDSWVRHEAQVREAEQRELVQTVLANVQKQLGDKKLQRDILAAGVAEIESESSGEAARCVFWLEDGRRVEFGTGRCRWEQGVLGRECISFGSAEQVR